MEPTPVCPIYTFICGLDFACWGCPALTYGAFLPHRNCGSIAPHTGYATFSRIGGDPVGHHLGFISAGVTRPYLCAPLWLHTFATLYCAPLWLCTFGLLYCAPLWLCTFKLLHCPNFTFQICAGPSLGTSALSGFCRIGIRTCD